MKPIGGNGRLHFESAKDLQYARAAALREMKAINTIDPDRLPCSYGGCVPVQAASRTEVSSTSWKASSLSPLKQPCTRANFPIMELEVTPMHALCSPYN